MVTRNDLTNFISYLILIGVGCLFKLLDHSDAMLLAAVSGWIFANARLPKSNSTKASDKWFALFIIGLIITLYAAKGLFVLNKSDLSVTPLLKPIIVFSMFVKLAYEIGSLTKHSTHDPNKEF